MSDAHNGVPRLIRPALQQVEQAEQLYLVTDQPRLEERQSLLMAEQLVVRLRVAGQQQHRATLVSLLEGHLLRQHGLTGARLTDDHDQ